MLKHLLRAGLLIAGWLLITACGSAGVTHFTPPAERAAPRSTQP